ncbi:class IV adenylate cyclase [Aedoeadaptatus urinae]|uniref:class IV adenylate cyclase n=1 Tax=Aedoeadaptatus urinae TaxID=1871017 RepID=UPI00097D3CB3|nr:class IV adenylate cyclase [Peptoniphilus urinae]
MEREIEVKVLHVDLDEMERRLVELGGEKIGEEQQTNYLIDSATHPIAAGLGYLRIRRIQRDGSETIQCTFKEKKSDEGVRAYDEHTVIIDDAREMLAIFALLGYGLVEEAKKHRISYAFKGCRIDLDRWDPESFPEPYMEIEGPSKEAIDEVIAALSVDREQVSTKSIAELKKSWNK